MEQNRLRELREARGLSQTEVGERLGLSARAVSLHELGQVDLLAHQIAAYARLYGCRHREIFVESPTTPQLQPA